MALPRTIRDVPAAQVAEVIQSFIDNDGAVRVTAIREVKFGRVVWTVTAE